MAKVAAFHTDSTLYRPEDKLVYHDNDECGYGQPDQARRQRHRRYRWPGALRALRHPRGLARRSPTEGDLPVRSVRVTV